jgi:hypothetical protein
LIKVEGVKKEMFEVLSKHCMWEAHHHEDVEKNLYYVARLRLKDLLYDERQAYKVKHDPQKIHIGLIGLVKKLGKNCCIIGKMTRLLKNALKQTKVTET